LNQLDESLKYYRQLGEVQEDSNAAFTGLYETTDLLMQEQRWQEALTLVEEIDRRYPQLDLTSQEEMHSWRGRLADKFPRRQAVQGDHQEVRHRLRRGQTTRR
jgi:hypothetical protein